MIPSLSQRVRSDPEAVAREWAGLPEAERQDQVRHLLETCPPLPYRPFQTKFDIAARQLVVAEVVDAYRERCETGRASASVHLSPFKDFYESDSGDGNRFYLHYEMEWKKLQELMGSHPDGVIRYLSAPERTADLVRAVGYGREPADPSEMSRWMTEKKGAMPRLLKLSFGEGAFMLGTLLYLCEDFVPKAPTMAAIMDGLQWMVDQGYRPVSVALRRQPGGAHRDAHQHPPCEHSDFKFRGMYVAIGVYPGRTPCTVRHEVSHSVYHQLWKERPHVIDEINEIYDQAMAADAGLFFNDEYYMDYFVHAGHPMHNANEFFASAAHAITHHPERVEKYLNDPRTPRAVRHYAQRMVDLLQTQVFRK